MMKIEPNDEGLAELETIRRRLAELESSQRLGLVWRDIPEGVETKLRDEVPVFVHEKELDVPGANPSDSPHILIEGDNLHALHVLQATHKGRVDVIYIDPPYNTGNDFVYNDKLVDRESPWRHSAWLSFMEHRLRLAKDLLAVHGLICVSIDDNEQARLKMLLDSIFGESNFVACLIWGGKTGGQDAKTFNRLHEYVLVYARDLSVATIKPNLVEADLEKYPQKDRKSGRRYKTQLARKWGSNSLREDRPNLWYSVTAPDGKKCWPLHGDGTEGCWRWGQDRFEREMAAGNVEFQKDSSGRWVAYQRIWAPGEGEMLERPRPTRLPEECSTTASGSRELKAILGKSHGFDYPKPVALITWLLESTGGTDATVLDYFAGSGTTAHAVAALNATDGGTRRCILVTNNENGICRTVTQPRIKAVLTGKWKDGKTDPLPGSLVFFRTDFVKRSKSPDRMRTEIARHTVDLVAVKESTARTVSRNATLAVLKGAAKTVAVVPGLDPDHAELRKVAEKKVEDGDKKIVYLFTWSDHGVEEEVAALWPGWEVNPLPAEMLAALRRLAPPARLFDDLGGVS